MGQKSSSEATSNNVDCPQVELSTAPALPLGTQTRFEGERGPFTLKTGTIGDELLKLILEDDSGCCLLSNRKELLKGGFIEANDFPVHTPGFPKRYKVEGFQHGLAIQDEVEAQQVRTGIRANLPPANHFLRAFVLTVIETNKPLFDALTDAMPEDFSMLRELFARRKCLSDLAVQVSHGEAAGHPWNPLHIDNVNSVLHLAISLKGSRTLNIGYPDNHQTQFSLDQSSGCVYLSSPWAFRHGVRFPQQTWEERVIAVQCRTLTTVEENIQICSQIHGREEELASCVTDVLERHELHIPTADEVRAMRDSLLVGENT